MVQNPGRRRFLKNAAKTSAAMALMPALEHLPRAPHIRSSKIQDKVMILGMDGMDPNLVRRFMAEGRLPHFKKLMELGKFGELQTTMPPHSPVAWSSFITGCNPGGHGIFDFIHRDPKSFSPYLSTSRSFDASKSMNIGKWSIPLGSGSMELMRKGPAFWSILEEHDIPSSILQIPANFPVTTDKVRALSGMGTPDLLGGYGTFTYYSDTPVPGSETMTGGRVVGVRLMDHRVKTKLSGPKNSFRSDPTDSIVEFQIDRDSREKTLRIRIQNHDIILRQGEWSEWLPLSFELVPMFASVGGMVRFFAKEIHPNFKLYATPINIDPMEPTLPICSPAGLSRELSQAVGRFYTQGFPADTKGLSTGVLSDDEYLEQALGVFDESMRLFDYELSRFDEGLFFFYFSSIDQNCHMLLRAMDPSHPLYNPAASEKVKLAVRDLYDKMDQALELALTKVDNHTTLFALSDHGFSKFTREFNLSTWLVENGFTVLKDPSRLGEGDFYKYVDWSKTKAYALGINGLYLNLRDREKNGSLDPDQADEVKREIQAKLPTVRDPANGNPIITNVYDPYKIYSGPFVSLAPDLVVGYHGGYRSSDESVLGKFPKEVVTDRTDKWSADHCMDPAVVPGILLSNKTWSAERPGLWDMAPTILRLFGLPDCKEMDGKSIL